MKIYPVFYNKLLSRHLVIFFYFKFIVLQNYLGNATKVVQWEILSFHMIYLLLTVTLCVLDSDPLKVCCRILRT